ncbi:MAG: hypothetical protein ACYS17_01340 [Planctomycetota bacterium]|jgi:hypothetical protein
MKRFYLYVHIVLFAALLIYTICPKAQAQNQNYDKAIEKYVQFLKKQSQSPADYVMNLFRKYDIVVLCERAHPEMTQYDFILDILSDKRFTEQVGHIYTEAGTSSMGPDIETFLMNIELDEKAVEERLRHICRDMSWYPHREMTSYYELLKKVHQLNRNLSRDKRIHIFPSDMPFNWDGMTAAKYRVFRKELGQRDKIMADQIADKFDIIYNTANPRKKALVIMNYRHAFPHLEITLGRRTKKFENVGGFLMTYYPEQVANVMINSIRLLPGTTDNKAVMTALQDGKWDAAFAVLGNPDVGFDFEGSPFGDDSFDYFPVPSKYRYRNVFTGFIFHSPLDEHKMSMGIPNLFDAAFVDELIRRYEIEGEMRSRQEIVRKIEKHKTIRQFGYENRELYEDTGYKNLIQKWLRAN